MKSKNKQEESRKPMTQSSEQRKNKKQARRRPLERFRTLSAGGARLGMIEVRGRLKMPSILAVHSKKKEIVQYHPPRGRP